MTLFSFFFSSRRRHTRCGRDWSSDVCSSDLYFAFDPGKVFFASADGKTMLYGYGDADGIPAGVCRSTDGGKSFFPVAFPKPPAESELDPPYAIVMTPDGSKGFAAYSNDLIAK